MFVVFGTRSTLLRTVPLPHAPCPHCGRAGNLQAGVFGNSFRAGLFPIAPAGKFVKVHCGHCQVMLFESALPPDLQAVARQLKAESRTPLRHYFGVAALAGSGGALAASGVAMAAAAWVQQPAASAGANARALWHAATNTAPDLADYAWVAEAQRRGSPPEVAAVLRDPHVGDLLTLQAGAKLYLLQRVVAVTPDSFRLQNSAATATTLPARLELDKPGGYADFTFALPVPRDSATLRAYTASGRYVEAYRP